MPSFAVAPRWQPLSAQLAVKIGCTAPENDTLAFPHVHLLFVHVCPGAQTTPHAPQFEVSLATHVPPQRRSPDGQTQCPLLHVMPPEHTTPQPPQLEGSDVVLMHAPLHRESPVGHAHAPLTHDAPEGHATVHEPQCVELVFVSTQEVPHCVSEPHPVAQPPFKQTWPDAHVWPHEPQLSASDDSSTHAPLQTIVPVGQTHLPALHDAPVAHLVPHAPQLVALVCVSVHVAPHATRGLVHPHAPAAQLAPAGQAWPHVPQLAGSDCVLVHAVAPSAPPSAPPAPPSIAGGSAVIHALMHDFCPLERSPPSGMWPPHGAVPATFW